MSDLLAKCDWNGDELRVELPQWPEVVAVWVDGKAMPFAPVTDDHKRIYDRCINRVGQLEAENEKLRELVAEIWPIAEYAGYEHELRRAHELMRELGYEEVEQ